MEAFRREELLHLAELLQSCYRSIGPGITAQDAALIGARLLMVQSRVAAYRTWFKSNWYQLPDAPPDKHPF